MTNLAPLTSLATAAVVSPETLVDRARAMIPALKTRSAAGTAQRRLAPETMREMRDAGFLRVLQPRRYGGYEMDPQTFFEIQMALAGGCMSSAWFDGVLAVPP